METKKITIESVEHSDQYEEAMKNDALVYSLGSDPEYSRNRRSTARDADPFRKRERNNMGEERRGREYRLYRKNFIY